MREDLNRAVDAQLARLLEGMCTEQSYLAMYFAAVRAWKQLHICPVERYLRLLTIFRTIASADWRFGWKLLHPSWRGPSLVIGAGEGC